MEIKLKNLLEEVAARVFVALTMPLLILYNLYLYIQTKPKIWDAAGKVVEADIVPVFVGQILSLRTLSHPRTGSDQSNHQVPNRAGLLSTLYLDSTLIKPPLLILVITGCSAGMGADLARIYAKDGANLVIMARREAELNVVATECRKLGASSVLALPIDVASEDEIKKAVKRIGDEYGRIDLFVANAGISMGYTVQELNDLRLMRNLMDINYFGTIGFIIYGLHLLKKSAQPKISIISSVAGIFGSITRCGYSGSKFALKGFCDALSLEEPSFEISILFPGVVKTDLNRTREGSVQLNMDQGMECADAAELIHDAVKTGKRYETWTFRAKALYLIRDVLPDLRDSFWGGHGRKYQRPTAKKE
ncbi:hypothetical protein SmJEL517_g05240 [Synchytrium microbalum]|uniref:Uncharacterized protein n=1 Tax=Synchytrium microbalum TaxID=1806994 RepID=A0A507C029_9FUNG|nr:uncharacterized protein SmJEL517_g05240 [Synchytrium microbalum]TPX31404.1 hypothetical protein SmJEL517_g05240 [Synchytrium microbalum]